MTASVATMSIVTLVVLIAVAAAIMELTQPRMVVSSQLVSPVAEGYCVGDSVIVHTHFVSLRPNLIVLRVATWWDVDSNTTAIAESAPAYSVYPDTVTIDKDNLVTIPNLVPGHYEYRRGFQAFGDGLIIIGIPIAIKDCPK